MDWRLLILRISKFACAGLVLLHIILTVAQISDWKSAIIWVYEVLFCAMLLGNVFGWVATKISLVTRYMQFMHKNIGYGLFVIFVALLALATPIASNINFINLVLVALGVLQIVFGIFYMNSVFEDRGSGVCVWGCCSLQSKNSFTRSNLLRPKTHLA